jgi:hypothetical protein
MPGRFALILLALFSQCIFVHEKIHSEETTDSGRPAWIGLTPLYKPEDGLSSNDPVKEAERTMIVGRQAFWYGLGGLLASVAFDAMKIIPARTLSYAVWGGGWATWLGSYGKATSILSGNSRINSDAGSQYRNFSKASTQGEIGESSNLFLIPDGVYVHPIYNDVNGGTDKLLTGSAKMGLLISSENLGFESVAYWRLLTPSFRSEFGQPDSPIPVGRYADWQEIKSSLSGTWNTAGLKVRHQLSVGHNDVGPKGGKELHQMIHKLTGNSLDNLEYTNQPEGRFWSFSEEIGLIYDSCEMLLPCYQQYLSAEATQSRFMTEIGMRYNLIQIQTPRWWENALEFRIIRQLNSEVYQEFRPWRYEAAIGFRLLRVITPVVKYVSPYLTGDDVGQTYFDLLHYNFEF